jgi:hypothetical protein
LLEKLARDWEQAPLGHPRAADRAGVLEDKNGVRSDREVGLVDALLEVSVVVEGDGGSTMNQQAGVGRGMFNDAPLGGEVACNTAMPPSGLRG